MHMRTFHTSHHPSSIFTSRVWQLEPITQGSPAYAAPEQLTGSTADGISARQTLSPTVDVWALGATLCEMLVGCPPFEGHTFEELVHNVLTLRYAPRVLESCDSDARAVIEGMLQILPCDRSTVKELCACSWVAQGGALPPETTQDVELQIPLCTDCDEDPDAGRLRAAFRRYSSRFLGPTACASPQSWDRRVLLVVYTLLCGFALWWSRGDGSERTFTLGGLGERQQFQLAS